MGADNTESTDTLVICPYQTSLLVGSLDSIQCSHRADD